MSKRITTDAFTSVLSGIEQITEACRAAIGNYQESDYLISRNERLPEKMHELGFQSKNSIGLANLKDLTYDQKQFLLSVDMWILPSMQPVNRYLISEMLDYALNYSRHQEASITHIQNRKGLTAERDALDKSLTTALEQRDKAEGELTDAKAHIQSLGEISEDRQQTIYGLQTAMKEAKDVSEREIERLHVKVDNMQATLDDEEKRHADLLAQFNKLKKDYLDIVPMTDAAFGVHMAGGRIEPVNNIMPFNDEHDKI